ncbi:MAG: DUF1566 domain-containing protein, partial [Pseudomonadales bacterium]|nr:DUF1566 domain-containing protein [Pseudomonadales bacterium]
MFVVKDAANAVLFTQTVNVACPTGQLSNNGQCFVPQPTWTILPSSGLLINSEFCGDCVQGVKNYTYDWGDGTAAQTLSWQNQTALVTSHSYAQAGTYTVTLSLSDASQTTISQQKQLVVSLKGVISVSNVEPTLGQTISLKIDNVLQDIKSVVWTISNGVTNVAKQIADVFSFTTNSAGEQTITAQLKDAKGNLINSLNSTIAVHPQCTIGQKEQNYACVDVPLAISSISPSTLTQNSKTKITVTGSNLPTTAVFSLQDGVCEAPIEQTSSQFSQFCTANSTGTKTVTVKYQANIEAGKTSLALQVNAPTAQATGLLNDTGIIECSNENTLFADCTATTMGGWFGLNQDAQLGRDALATQGQLSKVGAGDAGFDFTKISATGAALPANATAWSCVQDNHTGLMWEVKTDDGGLRDKDNSYTWYNPNAASNGGFEGYQDYRDWYTSYTQSTCGDSLSKCNTQAFAQAVNAQGLCGHNDWRLPNVEELRGIVNYNKYNPAIDTAYFVNTQSDWYWSSSPVAYNSSDAWFVYFDHGGGYNNNKYVSGYVRLVRSSQ